MLAEMERCQGELHKWGSANQVSFDKDKEGMFILSRTKPYGTSFDLLGIHFDCKLVMSSTVEDLAKTCRWKLKAILRTGRFNSGMSLVNLYKAQLLSFIEYRTAAVYHACDSSLALLDEVQARLVTAAGMTKLEALTEARLAPLCVRRDIAMLGVIHRTVLGRGPEHFQCFFKADANAKREGQGKHRLQLLPLPNDVSDFMLPGSQPANYIQNSMFGLIAIYNLLPAQIVEASPCVPSFQKALQELVMFRANAGYNDWENTLSPRVSLYKHPLRSLR